MTVLTSRKTTPDAQTRAGIRLLCQTDLFALSKTILYRDAKVPMTRGFHMPICQWLHDHEADPIRLLLSQRGSYKTGLWNAALNTQRILNDPGIRILLTSNKSENAEGMLSETKACLANEILIWAFPDILVKDPERNAPRWTTGAITVKRKRQRREATIETIGQEGEITSRHFDHITHDDLVGEKNSQTREQVLSTIDWWQKAQGLLEPHSTQDILGTPWHHADLYCWLIDQHRKGVMKVAVYRRACWEDPDGRVPSTPGPKTVATFPEMWPIPKLLALKGIQGSAVFAAQRLLDPISEETAVFLREKIKRNILPRRDLPSPDDLWVVMTVDPAISTNKWADFSAIAVTGFDNIGRMVVLDLRRGRWPESELLAQMYESYRRFPMIRTIGFEAIGFQKIYRRLLTIEGDSRGQYLPVVALERDTKTTKSVRIRALQPLWEAGEILLADDLPALEDFLDEAERFRLDREAAHDDMLDALVDSLQLRINPGAKEKEVLIDDPEVAERIAFEQAILHERPTTDRLSLRNAWTSKIRRENYEQEVAMGSSAMLEFGG